MQNLRTRRQAQGYTQQTFASALGVNQSTVAFWEAGTKYPTADKLPVIARVLKCTIDELYGDKEKKEAG